MEPDTRPSDARRGEPRLRVARILIPLVFALIVLSILTEEIPALRDARERLVHPAEYQARKACHEAALAAAEQPIYARIVAEGEAHPTRGAMYVEGVRVGEMGEQGGEVTFGFSCYVDAGGKVVRTQKQKSEATTRAGGAGDGS